MTSRDFCYWLQGYFEIHGKSGQGVTLSQDQLNVVRNHLDMVFKHEIDPSHGDAKHQEDLSALHQGKPVGAPSALSQGSIPSGPILRC